MRDLDDLARRTYGRHLETDEAVSAVADATAGGSGTLIGIGMLIGILAGALYTTVVATAAALPVMTLGAFGGLIGGYLVAESRAHGADGPGAAVLRIVMTNQRLLVLRRNPSFRIKPLRSYPITDIDSVISGRSHGGAYRKVRLQLGSGRVVDLYVAGPDDIEEWYEQARRRQPRPD